MRSTSMSPLPLLFLSSTCAFALGACETGHYTTRDHVVPAETAGEEAPGSGGQDVDDPPEGGEAVADGGPAADEGAAAGVGAESSTGDSSPEPEPVRAQTPPASATPEPGTRITVRSAMGPISRWVAEQALAGQRPHIDQCYRTVLRSGPGAGSIRAMLTVEASGRASAELETMTPELDRVIPCVDGVLERTRFPSASDGRPTHVILEVSLSPP